MGENIRILEAALSSLSFDQIEPVRLDTYSVLTALINIYTQVSEASVSRNRSTIIVPAGSARSEGWAAFRNILAEINEASRLFIMPNQVPLCCMLMLLPFSLKEHSFCF